MKRKPRNKYIYIGDKEKFKGISLENGDVHVILESGEKVKPDDVFSQISYERKKGKEKVLNLIPEGAAINAPLYLANVIFAIDTNTKLIDDEKISISTCVEAYFKKINDDTIQLLFRNMGNIIFKTPIENIEEKIAWVLFIKKLMVNKRFISDKIAIITDHDLGNHGNYNKRKAPILDNFYLPKNITFIYASTDSGSENIINKLLSICDKDAKNIIKILEDKKEVIIKGKKITLHNIPIINVEQ
jgi:hypothetical protein